MLTEKISALQQYCSDQKADALLLVSLTHEVNDAIITYLLGYEPEHAVVLITPHTAILWLTPFEVTEAALQFPAFEVRALHAQLPKLITEVLQNATVLVRSSVLPVHLHTTLTEAGYNVKPVQNIEQVVAQKNTSEIAAMRAVCAQTDELFSELIAQWPSYTTEQDAARSIYRFALEHNCTVSFPPIIACGANAAEPHHQTNATPLCRGFCVIDLGLRSNGYCSDMSRTIFIGKPNAEEVELYELVKKAQAESVALVKPGAKAADIDAACRAILGDYEKNFIHGLGHGVGTAVHEWPAISAMSMVTLAPNMIITIEPGIYLPGKLGIRIEDDVLVTHRGCEVLHQTGKELIIVD